MLMTLVDACQEHFGIMVQKNATALIVTNTNMQLEHKLLMQAVFARLISYGIIDFINALYSVRLLKRQETF